MDFRNRKNHYSDHIAKAELREKLEEAMKNYKGKITIIENKVDTAEQQMENKLRKKIKLFLEEVPHIVDYSKECGINQLTLYNLRNGSIIYKLSKLKMFCKKMGIRV